jgi:lipid-A-disaccharide synthase
VDTRREIPIAIVAGEASGDLHGSRLVAEVRALVPEASFFGIGGDRMRRAGVEVIQHSRDMAVLGFSEVVRRLPFLHGVLRRMVDLLLERDPALVVLIDYPGFNLRLAERAHGLGRRVAYYISPQLWAWGRNRLAQISRHVDHMIVVFAFEEELYRSAGVAVTFVGHPLLDVVRPTMGKNEFATVSGFDPSVPIVGLLPGSRQQELRRILPVMISASLLIREQLPQTQFLVGLAPEIGRDAVDEYLRAMGGAVKVVQELTYDVMKHSDVLLVASGTATLESAILETPLLVIYRMSPLSYWIARLAVRIPDIGLVNVVAGRRVVPEFVQDQARPRAVADAAIRWLQDPPSREQVKKDLRQVRMKLGEVGAARRAAAVISEMLKEHKP